MQKSHIKVGRDTHTVASVKTFNASSAANFLSDSICLISCVPFHPHHWSYHLKKCDASTKRLGIIIHNTIEKHLKRQSAENMLK